MVLVISIIKHGNWHVVIEIYNNVTFVVKLLVVKYVFKKILGHDLGDNAKSTNTDLFSKGKAVLIRSIPL